MMNLFTMDVTATQFNLKRVADFPYRIFEYGIAPCPINGFKEGGAFKDDNGKTQWIADTDWIVKIDATDNQEDIFLILSNVEKNSLLREEN